MDMLDVEENLNEFKIKIVEDILVFLIFVVIKMGFCELFFVIVDKLEIILEFLFNEILE